MDFEQLVMARRTVHNYLTERVSNELVIEALRLSLWVPNHKLTYPWVYTLIGPQARSALADLNVELKSSKGPLNEIKAKAARESILNPSHLILLGIKKSSPGQQHENYATLAASVQTASLYLWKNGIASKWSTGGWSGHLKTYEILRLDPEAVMLEGALMIGMPQIVPAASERPRLDQFLRTVE